MNKIKEFYSNNKSLAIFIIIAVFIFSLFISNFIHKDVSYKKALANIETRQWDKALNELSKTGHYKDSDLKRTLVLFNLSLIKADEAMKNKEYDKAISHYNDAKSLKHSSLEAKTGYEKASKLKAEADEKKIARHISNGNKYLTEKKWDDAINEYNLAIKLNPDLNSTINPKIKNVHKLKKAEKKAKIAIAVSSM